MNTLVHRGARAARMSLLLAAVATMTASVGCGGTSRSRPTAPTQQQQPQETAAFEVTEQAPARDISKEERADYTTAIAYFKQQEANGWNADSCQKAAAQFAEVAAAHTKLLEARYMAGVAYQRCGMDQDATQQYQLALRVAPNHAHSLSNLGELAFKAGNVKKAREYWEKAVEAEGKLVAARNNLAWLLLEEMRRTKPGAAWRKLESAARTQLSSALAVNNEQIESYVLFALVYMEGSRRNKNRLDLAKLLLDEGAKRNDKYAPLYNARGLLQMRKNNQGEALANFQRAVALDENFIEARLNVGNITLGFRKYDVSEQQFSKVLAIQPNSYDAQLGLGIAQRGLGKLDEAEASYQKAIEIDSQRGAAHFNLGVLYKDFRANSANDLPASKQAYETARKHFQTFLSKRDVTRDAKKEAQANIGDCNKIIKQLGEIIKASAQAQASN